MRGIEQWAGSSRRRRGAWAVAIAVGTGGLLTASASGPGPSVFVPITPCRLMDTRPGSDNVGQRATPIGSGETYTAAVHGTNGECTIPTTATSVVMNVAIVNPTAPSFLTIFPADVDRPLSANQNWVAGQAPTPNGTTSTLSATGSLAFYNLTGTVDLVVDIAGYYQPGSGGGPAGPAGPAGPGGPPGPAGPANRISDVQIGREAWFEDPGRLRTFTTASGPFRLAFDGVDLWGTYADNTVRRINRSTGATTTSVAVGGAATDLAFDGTHLWATNGTNGTVRRIVPATGAATTFTAGAGAGAVAFAVGKVFTADTFANTVSRIDPLTGARQTVAVPGGPTDLVYDGSSIWVLSVTANSVSEIDPNTLALTGTSFVPLSQPTSLLHDGRYLWVTNRNSSSTTRYDPVLDQEIDVLLDTFQQTVAYDGRHLWFAQYAGLMYLLEVDGVRLLDQDPVVQRFPLGFQATDVLFDGRNVWVAGGAANRLRSFLP